MKDRYITYKLHIYKRHLLLNFEKHDLPVSLAIAHHFRMFEGISTISVPFKSEKFEMYAELGFPLSPRMIV